MKRQALGKALGSLLPDKSGLNALASARISPAEKKKSSGPEAMSAADVARATGKRASSGTTAPIPSGRQGTSAADVVPAGRKPVSSRTPVSTSPTSRGKHDVSAADIDTVSSEPGARDASVMA